MTIPRPLCRYGDGSGVFAGLDVCQAHLRNELGVSYRQLDYWVRRGWVKPVHYGTRGARNERIWPAVELLIARRMGELIADGWTVEAAAAQARSGQTSAFRSPAASTLHPAGASRDWRDRIACGDEDPLLFTSDDPELREEGKRVCWTCSVMGECFAYAERIGATHGVFGGADFGTRMVPLEDAS